MKGALHVRVSRLRVQSVRCELGVVLQSYSPESRECFLRGRDSPKKISRKCIGVIQMINKIDFDHEIGTFLEEDVEVLETFTKFVGEKLNSSTLLAGGAGKPKETFSEVTGMTVSGQIQRRRSSGKTLHEASIVEEDDQ